MLMSMSSARAVGAAGERAESPGVEGPAELFRAPQAFSTVDDAQAVPALDPTSADSSASEPIAPLIVKGAIDEELVSEFNGTTLATIKIEGTLSTSVSSEVMDDVGAFALTLLNLDKIAHIQGNPSTALRVPGQEQTQQFECTPPPAAGAVAALEGGGPLPSKYFPLLRYKLKPEVRF